MPLKGLAFAVNEVLQITCVVACIIIVVFLWKGYYFDVGIKVSEGREERNLIALANILLSSPRLAYEEDGRIQRAILDSSKLSSVSINDLIDEVCYPNTRYVIKVTSLKTQNSWEIKPDLTNYELKYEKKFPVSIKFDDEIHFGIMEVELYYKSRPERPQFRGGRERV